jgi:hypothetical protein
MNVAVKIWHNTKILLSQKPIIGIASGFTVPFFEVLQTLEPIVKSIGVLFATGVAVLTFAIKWLDWKVKKKEHKNSPDK